MKDGFLKIALAAPIIRVADPCYNLELCASEAKKAFSEGARVILFPELTLSSMTCGDFFYQQGFLKKCKEALFEYAKRTADLDMISFIGLPVLCGSSVYNGIAAVKSGEILGISTYSGCADRRSEAKDRYFAVCTEAVTERLGDADVLIGENIIYTLDSDTRVKIFVSVGSDADDPASLASYAAKSGANLILRADGYHEVLGIGSKKLGAAVYESERLTAAYAVCSAGEGESGTDGIFSGRRIIASLGECISHSEAFDGNITYGVVDLDAVNSQRMKKKGFFEGSGDFYEVEFALDPVTADPAAPRKHPFIPATLEDREAASELALTIAGRALAGRLQRARAACCVLGVSGGLDSTLAVLVCERAMDVLGWEKNRVIAVTMPCFGTTVRTKNNAILLSEELGLSVRTVDIKAAVTQHFADIGQDPENYDVVYENSQARERTQILMDIANMENGLVVGTGDLSEIALGFATYNGDHMSMYSVNGSVPKTLMREIIRYSAKSAYKKGKGELAKVLLDVIDTPVSPELLPTDGTEVSQPTESIVGPYELHDFFIYYTVKFGFSQSKIKRLALLAFSDKYSEEQIADCYAKFTRRFVSSQFKRSCMPDGPIITEISLSPRGAFSAPSDASLSVFGDGE